MSSAWRYFYGITAACCILLFFFPGSAAADNTTDPEPVSQESLTDVLADPQAGFLAEVDKAEAELRKKNPFVGGGVRLRLHGPE